MREIKFRAWDKEEKIMKEVKSLEWPLGDGMRCEARDWYDDYDERWVWGKVGERYEVMEFTGLKDKNGKEIYEGDILTDYEWEKHGPREVRFGEEWIDASDYEDYSVGAVCFYLTNYLGNKNGFEGLNSLQCDHLEIIGNIYENPELIK